MFIDLNCFLRWAMWPMGLLLAHLSRRLKWAFLIKICPLSVVVVVVVVIIFSSSSPEQLGQFQPNLAQCILGWRGFKFVSSLNQHYDIVICVYWFELFSQVSNVAHGPLVSSPEPKTQVSFSYQNLSFVRCGPCHRLRHCRKLFTFSSSSPE